MSKKNKCVGLDCEMCNNTKCPNEEKEKIIDGIDVSEWELKGVLIPITECKYFEGIGDCKESKGLCVDNEDCYFKQLKRLQEENKELKKRCEEWAWDSVKLQAQIDSKDYQLNRYKEILKDIRDIIEMPKYTCKEFLYIRGKINEVLCDDERGNN